MNGTFPAVQIPAYSGVNPSVLCAVSLPASQAVVGHMLCGRGFAPRIQALSYPGLPVSKNG